jgi:hypothetical protein
MGDFIKQLRTKRLETKAQTLFGSMKRSKRAFGQITVTFTSSIPGESMMESGTFFSSD